MKIEMKDGRVFGGSELEIVEQMRARAFGREQASIHEYATWVVAQAKEFERVDLSIAGSTDEEIAKSLLAEMKRVELAAEFDDQAAVREA